MVVVSGPALITGGVVLLCVGGSGLYAILKFCNGGEDFHSISNSTIGLAQWEMRSTHDLIGLNFDFNSGGIIFEVGMILMMFFIVFLCFCCGCRHCENPRWMRERKQRKVTKRREKARRKREVKLRDEEMIKEGSKRKAMRKHLRHKEKVAKGVASGHWKFRGITDDHVKKILGRGFGEGGLTDGQVKEKLRK